MIQLNFKFAFTPNMVKQKTKFTANMVKQKTKFTANMVKQKDPEWNVFDIIEAQVNFQGKDDIN